MNEKLDLHVQELEDRFEKRMTSLSKRIAQLELENLPDDDEEEEEKKEMTPFQTAIDILSGRITELEAKLNETQGLLYTTRRELEGTSTNFVNSVIADIPVRLQRLEESQVQTDKLLGSIWRSTNGQ